MTLVTNSELSLWNIILPGCKVVFDVGVRNDTDIMDLFPNVVFHVFEPNPTSYNSLLDNLRNTSNVITNNVALGNTTGKLLYYSDTESIVRRTHDATSNAVPFEIDVITLDDYCEQRQIHQIDFLKIDVEGFELEVMKGGRNIISRACRYIQFEYGGTFVDMNITLQDIYSFLEGWTLYRITNTGLEIAPIVREDYGFCNYLAIKDKIQDVKLLIATGQYDAAIPKLQAMIEENDQNSDAQNDLGYVYQQMGDYGKAMEYFGMALSSNMLNYQALRNTLVLSDQLGIGKDALQMLKDILEQNPDDPTILRIVQAFVNDQQSQSKQNRFQNLVRHINPQTVTKHDEILLWAETCENDADRFERPELFENDNDPIVRNGHALSNAIKQQYKNRFLRLPEVRILIQIPPLGVSPGGYSLFTNMMQALAFTGVAVKALGWDEPIEPFLSQFKPTVFMTSDHQLYLSRIDWNAVSRYRQSHDLKIGLTASLQEYGNTPLSQRLEWAKQHNVDFFYSFRAPEYLKQRKEYVPFFENGYKIFSIEFGANPLVHYPVPKITKDIDYIFLASSNSDKWPRYFDYLSDILTHHPGFIDGPGWGFQKQSSTLNKDRYLYARSKIGLNLHLTEQIEWPCELNERTYILAACGVPQLIDNPKLLLHRFDEKGLFIAHSPKDYYELFKTILHSPEEATQRALIAQREVFQSHTWFHRVEGLVLSLVQEFFAPSEHGLMYGTDMYNKVNSNIVGAVGRVGGSFGQLLRYDNCNVEDINLQDGGFGRADEKSIIMDMHNAHKDPSLVSKYDSLISSNVIEHSYNPILLLLNFYLVTKNTGWQFHAIPNHRYTYDVFRQPTSLQHIIEDFENLTDEADVTHAEDYIQSAIIKHGWQREFHKKYPIAYPYLHTHVFDEHNTRQLMEFIFQDVTIDLIRTKDFSDNLVLFRNKLNPSFVEKYSHIIKRYSDYFLSLPGEPESQKENTQTKREDPCASADDKGVPLNRAKLDTFSETEKQIATAIREENSDTEKLHVPPAEPMGETSHKDVQKVASAESLVAIVFSKDRAMQLEAGLRSFFRHSTGYNGIAIYVLYKTSTAFHHLQYEELKKNYPHVGFVEEADFKKDLLSLLRTKPSGFVLFLVDDNLFVRDCSLVDVLAALEDNPCAIGFSLRLGRNTTYCYMQNQTQILPDVASWGNNILKFAWTNAQHDFGYPLELSSSIYHIDDIIPLFQSWDFKNPNSLEVLMDQNKTFFADGKPELLCYETSVAFCNPANMVQTMWANKAGKNAQYSPEALGELFEKGYRINIDSFAGLVPNACHMEAEFKFFKETYESPEEAKRPSPLVSIIILSYNGVEHIKACIDSIQRNSTQKYEIIVVDNGKKDGSIEYLRSLPYVFLIENPDNLGPAVARAQGMAVAHGEYIAFLDDDTIVTREWLTKFIHITESHPDIGMVGAVSNYASGYQLVQNVLYSNLEELEAFARNHYETNKGRLTLTTRLVSFCLFVTRAVVDRIGTFDSRFGLFGFEDDDYSLRAYIAGLQPSVAHEIFIHHTGGPQGRGNAEYNTHLQEAWYIFKEKWGIPEDVPYGSSFDMATICSQPLDKQKHFIPIPSNGNEEAELNMSFARSRSAMEQGNVDEAIGIFDDIINKYPESGVAYAALGTLFSTNGEYEKAKDSLCRAVGLLPSEASIHLQLAQAYIHMNDTVNAEEVLMNILSFEPLNRKAISLLVGTLITNGRPNEAIEMVKSSLLENPLNPDLISIFGELAVIIGNNEALGVCIQKLREVAPSHPSLNELESAFGSQEYVPRIDSQETATDVQDNPQIPLTFVKLQDYSLNPAFLKEIQSIFRPDTFIETGTFVGSTTLNASKLFREVHTIELSEDLFHQAQARFHAVDNIHAYHGDSGTVLPKIISNIRNKILFWLDGHYSGEGTAKTDKNTPVLEEIGAIALSGKKDSVILIDDIRLFLESDMTGDKSGANGYPSLNEVCRHIKAIDKDYQYVAFGDILIAFNSPGFPFSPMVQACTISRLYDGSNFNEETLFTSEDMIRSAQSNELSAIETLYAVFRSDASASGHYRLWLALIRMGNGSYADAIQELLAAIGNGFYHWRLSLYLAEAYLQTGQITQACRAIERALKEAPQSIYVRKLNDIITEAQCSSGKDTASQQFKEDMDKYERLLEGTEKRFPLNRQELWCLNERTPTLSFDPHYVLHTSWAARVLSVTKPEKHIDISSSIYFSSIVSAFVPVDFYDYRPAPLSLSGFESGSADVTNLPFSDGSIESLSCMHVVEHIGLGRYGDPVDPNGDLKGINELKRVLKPGGNLLFVVPMGKTRLVFNAHRIYSYDQIIQYFDGFTVENFSLIPDAMLNNVWTLLEGSRELSDSQAYGCGCFWFKKKEEGNKQYRHKRIEAPQNVYARQLNDVKISADHNPDQDPVSQQLKGQTGLFQADAVKNSFSRTLHGYIEGFTSIVLPISEFNDSIRKCLESIVANAAKPYEIILAKSGSSKMPAWLKKVMATNTSCKIINAEKSASYAALCNKGLEKATGQYVLILDGNAILLNGSLERMCKCMDRYPEYGITVPMSNHAIGPQQIPKTQQMSFRDFEEYAMTFAERNEYRYIVSFEVDSICVLIKRELIDTIGLFNERIINPFFVINDYRMQALMEGYQAVISGDSCVFLSHDDMQRKGSDKTFHEQWDIFNPNSATGNKLSPFVAMKNSRENHGKGLLNESVGAIMEGIKYTPEKEDLYYCLAEILLDEKLYQESIEAIESLPEAARGKTRALEILGQCHFYLDRMKEAENYADIALSLSADSAKALNLKGLIARKQGDQRKAEDFFQQAITANPCLADPYVNIGVMKWHNNETGEALNLIEKGVILSPETGDFSTTYNAAITSLHEYSRAERVFTEACGLFPKNKSLSFLFIGILLRQEKYDEAMREIMNAILTFGADDEILSAALTVREKIGPLAIDGTGKKGDTVSVCMIVKNEEVYMARCMASLTPVAHEIIVVDTGSTDKTKEIAIAFGAQIFDFPWTNDFSEARNVSLEKAKGNWVLVHDADEVLSPLDYERFRQILRQKHPKPVAYDIITRNYIMEPAIDGWTANVGEYHEEESGSGWFPSNKVRLFTNDRRIRFCNTVHEILEPSIKQAGIEIKSCSIPIHHYGKLPTDTNKKKGDVYYLLGKRKVELMGNIPAAHRELAIQAEELGKHEEAIEHWKAYARAIPDKALPYFNMASVYLEMGLFEQALKAAQKAYEIDPHAKETVLTYATVSMCAGDTDEATAKLEELLETVPSYPPAQVALAASYCITGRKEKGITSMVKMKAKGYNYDPALHSLSRKLISAHRIEKAMSLLDSMMTWDNGNPVTIALLDECKRTLLRENT